MDISINPDKHHCYPAHETLVTYARRLALEFSLEEGVLYDRPTMIDRS